MCEFLRAVLRLSNHGHNPSYLRGAAGSFRKFVVYNDRDGLASFKDFEEIITKVDEYKFHLIERVRLKEIRRRSASSYIANLKNILIEILPLEYHERLEKIKISKKHIETDITSAPSDEQLLQYFGISKDIFTQLSSFVLESKKFPIHLTVLNDKYALIPHGNYPISNIAKQPKLKTSTQYAWDLEKLQVRPISKIIKLAEIDRKILTERTASRVRKRVFRRLTSANTNEYHDLRFRLARLANEAFVILFIAATAMNTTQAGQLNWETDKFETERKSAHFHTIKNRAKGKVVEFSIASTMTRHFRKYLELRQYLLRALGVESFPSLLIDFAGNTPRRVSSKLRPDYNRKLNQFFDFGGSLNFLELRVSKAQRFAIQHGAFVASQAVQNSPKTLIKHYLRGNKAAAVEELTGFFSSYPEILKENNTETTQTTLGQCRTLNAPNPINENVPYKPDCFRPEGCLFCTKFAVHASRTALNKLLSFSYIINLTASNSFNKSEPELLAINTKIEHLVELICDTATIKASELKQIRHSIEVENIMPKFWQYKFELLSDLGTI